MRQKPKSCDDTDEVLKSEAKAFISEFGLPIFLDVCQSAIGTLLVRKGLVTPEELRNAYLENIRKASKDGHSAKVRAAVREVAEARSLRG